MQRAIIIGSPGAGKSTFARKLRDRTGLPLYHLDLLWHRADRTHISRPEFDAHLREILCREQWIIDGNYQRTIEMRLMRCDTVFLLDFPPEVCLSGAKARLGTKHEDLPWTERELDAAFQQEILNFPKTQLPQIYQLLEKYRENRSIVRFRSRQDADAYLNRICTNPPVLL